MKNTKKVVALALALSVSSQAIPSYAEGVTADTSVSESVAVTEDSAAPSANDELKTVVDEEKGEVTISQNCIYDLESGIDEESVKAYVYEEGSKDKGEAIEMNGTSFSDFSVKAEMPETEGNLVVEVHASDLAGNESVVSKTTINKDSDKQADREYTAYYFQPENGYFNGEKITINPKKPFVIGADFTDANNNMSEVNIIVNTDANHYSNGVLFTGSFNSNGDSKGAGTDVVSIEKVAFENHGYGTTRANMTMNFENAKHASSYYIWVSDGSDRYFKVEHPIVMDTKAPVASENVDLTLSSDGMLFVSMDGVTDEGSNVKEVYALIKNDQLSEPAKVQMIPKGDSLTTKTYDGSFNMNKLNVNKGEFTVEVYAIDNCGNEGVVSVGTIEKDTKIESEEFVDITGYQNQVSGVDWFKHNALIDLSVLSESKDKVYDGVQVIINEDDSDPFNKVLSEFKAGSQEDFKNITDNRYVELVSGDYYVYKHKASGSTYSNELLAQLKLKDGAYNKKLHVWVRYYTDSGLTSKFTKSDNVLATDYTLPTVKVTEVSDGIFIKAEDKESGLKYVEVYDKDGLLITEDYSEANGLTVPKDKNPSTITIVDCVNNKIVYDVVNKKIIEAASTQGLPNAPTEADKYINLNEKPNTDKPDGENNDGQEKPDVKPEEKPDSDKPNNDGNGNDVDKPDTDKPNNDKPNNDGNGDKPNNDGNGDKPNNDGNGDKPNTEKPNNDKPNTEKPDSDGNGNNGNNGSNGDNNGGTGNGDVEKPNTDKPNTDGNGNTNNGDSNNGDSNNGGTNNGNTNNGGSNNGSTNNQQGGQAGTNGATNNGGANGATNNNATSTPAKPTLPQTGGTSSILVGAFGAVTSAIGYVLTRKRK